MITEITSEATLAGLSATRFRAHPGGFVRCALSSESRVKRKLSSPLIASLTHLIVPRRSSSTPAC